MNKLTKKQYRTNSLLALALFIIMILFCSRIPVASALIISQLACLSWCFRDMCVEKDNE